MVYPNDYESTRENYRKSLIEVDERMKNCGGILLPKHAAAILFDKISQYIDSPDAQLSPLVVVVKSLNDGITSRLKDYMDAFLYIHTNGHPLACTDRFVLNGQKVLVKDHLDIFEDLFTPDWYREGKTKCAVYFRYDDEQLNETNILFCKRLVSDLKLPTVCLIRGDLSLVSETPLIKDWKTIIATDYISYSDVIYNNL